MPTALVKLASNTDRVPKVIRDSVSRKIKRRGEMLFKESYGRPKETFRGTEAPSLNIQKQSEERFSQSA